MLSRLRSLLRKLFARRAASDSGPGHMYSLLRHQALAYDREILGTLARFPEARPDEPAWGVVMEMAHPGFSGTMAAFSNGQTSLYNSDGQAVVGDSSKEQTRQASVKLIAAANQAFPHLKPSASYETPAPWGALFYVRTDSGNLVTEAAGQDFRNERHPLFSLFTAGNELLKELKLAGAAQRKKDLLQRIAWSNKEIAQQPIDFELYVGRAELYAELGDFDEALADFNRVLALMPVADAFLGRGSIYFRMGDLTSALGDFNHAIELEPANAMAYSNRGSAYSKLQDMENALASYALAIQNNPRYPTTYTNRAYTYYKLGRYEEGVADCNRSLALRPNHAYTHSNRGLCRAALGDKQGARSDFQRALTIDSPPPAIVIDEALNGLHALDHPGEPMPVWKSPSVWVMPS